MLLRFFLMFILFSGLSSCKVSPFTKRSDTSKTYQFNPVANRCENSEGPGYNSGQIMECGLVVGLNLAGHDFSARNLRGLRLEDVNLSGSNFAASDLFGAELNNVNLSGSNLSNAILVAHFRNVKMENSDLRGAQFMVYQADGNNPSSTFDNILLTQSTINSRTVMDVNLRKAESEYKMRYEGADAVPSTMPEIAGIPFQMQIATKGNRAFSINEFAHFRSDIFEMTKYKLRDESSSNFFKIFGSSTMTSVLQKLAQSFHFVSAFTSSDDEEESRTLASNYDATFWVTLFNRSKKGADATVSFNGSELKVDRPAMGILSIGPKYVDLSTPSLRRYSSLVHEWRHSFCPELPSAADLKTYNAKQGRGNSLCNYMHAKCPAGHDLEGLEACDDIPFGSYAFGMIFLEKFYKDCVNCSEIEKQSALVFLMDAKSRLSTEILEKMQNGTLGEPNMFSVK